MRTARKIELYNGVHNIPLQERSNQIDNVISSVRKNLRIFSTPKEQISNSAKTDLLIPTFTGGSGIGKVKKIISFDYFHFTKIFRRVWLMSLLNS